MKNNFWVFLAMGFLVLPVIVVDSSPAPSKKTITHAGRISKVNPIARTFQVEGRLFHLSDTAQIFVDHVKKEISDIKDGDFVDVIYFFREKGVHHAIKVTKHSDKGNTAPPKKP